MAYQALYRKWRPRTFDSVIGQEAITDTLKMRLNVVRFPMRFFSQDPAELVKHLVLRFLLRH